MAALSFNSYVLAAFVLSLQVELFFSLCYSNIIFFTKQLRIARHLDTNTDLTRANLVNVYPLAFLVYAYTEKGFVWNYYIFILLALGILTVLAAVCRIQRFWLKTNYNPILTLLPWFGGYLLLMQIISSFLTLFFYVELFGVLYYFIFLSQYSLSSQTILKYKNGLLLLLWNNFFTTIFLSLGIFFFYYYFGTSNFEELAVVTPYSSFVYFFLIGFCWKVGLPLFHFFKLELYNYLVKENVFLFSILTTIVNIFFLYFVFSITIVLNTLETNFFISLVVFFAIALIILSLKLHSILQYFALSSVLTLTTISILFLVINVSTA